MDRKTRPLLYAPVVELLDFRAAVIGRELPVELGILGVVRRRAAPEIDVDFVPVVGQLKRQLCIELQDICIRHVILLGISSSAEIELEGRVGEFPAHARIGNPGSRVLQGARRKSRSTRAR